LRPATAPDRAHLQHLPIGVSTDVVKSGGGPRHLPHRLPLPFFAEFFFAITVGGADEVTEEKRVWCGAK
jgi:hypothetical protein